jgi:hypothetical protein
LVKSKRTHERLSTNDSREFNDLENAFIEMEPEKQFHRKRKSSKLLKGKRKPIETGSRDYLRGIPHDQIRSFICKPRRRFVQNSSRSVHLYVFVYLWIWVQVEVLKTPQLGTNHFFEKH